MLRLCDYVNDEMEFTMTKPSISQPQIGVILSKRGKVTATQASDTRILKRGDIIFADDVICTVRGANAQLKMKDNNIIMLRGGSTFKLSLYRIELNSNEVKRYEYIGGVLRPSVRPTPSHLVINTESNLLG